MVRMVDGQAAFMHRKPSPGPSISCPCTKGQIPLYCNVGIEQTDTCRPYAGMQNNDMYNNHTTKAPDSNYAYIMYAQVVCTQVCVQCSNDTWRVNMFVVSMLNLT